MTRQNITLSPKAQRNLLIDLSFSNFVAIRDDSPPQPVRVSTHVVNITNQPRIKSQPIPISKKNKDEEEKVERNYNQYQHRAEVMRERINLHREYNGQRPLPTTPNSDHNQQTPAGSLSSPLQFSMSLTEKSTNSLLEIPITDSNLGTYIPRKQR